MRRRHVPQAAVVVLAVFIICSTSSPCLAFQSTVGLSRNGAARTTTITRLAQSSDAAVSTNTNTTNTSSDESESAESAVDWTRADTSTQIFPGGPGLLLGLDGDSSDNTKIDAAEPAERTGAQEQSGYLTSAPYSRTLSYAKQKQKRTRELRRQMNKKKRRRRRPRPASVTGRVAALFGKLRGRGSENAETNEHGGSIKTEEDEDGYDLMYGTKQNKARHWLRHDGNAYYHNYEPRWKRLGKFVFRRNERQVEPGQLILVRHGESQWNANKVRY